MSQRSRKSDMTDMNRRPNSRTNSRESQKSISSCTFNSPSSTNNSKSIEEEEELE